MYKPLIDPNGKSYYLYHPGWGGFGHIAWIPLYNFASKIGLQDRVDYHLCYVRPNQYGYICGELLDAINPFCNVSFSAPRTNRIFTDNVRPESLPVACPEPAYTNYIQEQHRGNLFITTNYWLDKWIESGEYSYMKGLPLWGKEKISHSFGLDPKRPLVVFHIRSTLHSDSLRNCTPSLYRLVIRELIADGFNVIRLGAGLPVFEGDAPAEFVDLSRFFTISNTISIIDAADFFVGVVSGPASFRGYLGKHCLITNVPDSLLSLIAHPYPDYSFSFRRVPNEELTDREILFATMEYIKNPINKFADNPSSWVDHQKSIGIFSGIKKTYGYRVKHARILNDDKTISSLESEIYSSTIHGVQNS
jgi:hypothetical protein